MLEQHEQLKNRPIVDDELEEVFSGDLFLKRLKLRKVLEKLSDDDMNAIFSHLDDKDVNNLLTSNFSAVVGKMVKLFATRPSIAAALIPLIS